MSETHPAPWRCLNCRERVDPTMALCWNCGHDREGAAQPAMFVDEVDVDTSVCAACGYDLKGNPDATACPECGEPVPWEDCAVCGVRASRSVMFGGCPACAAKAAGRTFIPEVERKQYPACPACQYDFRGRPDVTTCPECGASIDRGRYETVVAAEVARPLTIQVIRRKRRYWITVLSIMFPLAFVLSIAAVISDSADLFVLARLLGLLLAAWVLGLVICIIQLFVLFIASQDYDDVGRRPR